jgi:hypothetical protein
MTDKFDAQLREIASAMVKEAPDAPLKVPSDGLDRAASQGAPVGFWRGTRIAAGAGLVLLLVIGGVRVFSPPPPFTPVGSEGGGVPIIATPTSQPTAPNAATSEDVSPAEAVPLMPVEASFEDPPHLLLAADGWEMISYYEDSYPLEYRLDVPQLFRVAGTDFGAATFYIFESSGDGWSAGEGAERIELDGRVLSVIADNILPIGHAGVVEFDDGTLVVLQGFGMDRTMFVDVATQITVTAAGELLVVPPPGYEQVVLPAPYSGTVTQRESAYQGPEGASAEVRIWSGTLADVQVQMFDRIIEGESVRSTVIDGSPALVAYQDGLSRIFVVGGAEGYVIEIDFNPLFVGATDADLDAILSQIRRVDLTTFEAALPGDAVTSETVDEVVAEMLSDIPLPTGFDSTALRATGDRYQVGAQVVSAVACGWIDQWVTATATGDNEQMTAAAEALATSHDWAILLEMQERGAYPQVLWEYADAIGGDGTVIGGRVLTVQESYQQALGCADK